MPNTNTAVITPKDIQSGVPSYEFRNFLAMEPDITAKLWPGVLFRDSLFRSDDVYVMNNEGQIVPSKVRMEDIGDYAYLGRLYARNSDGYLCQIQLIIENSDTLDFNISVPITIPEPTAPSFWTRVFAFFGHKASKKLIQVYNEMAAFAAALVELQSHLDYNIDLYPPQELPDAAANAVTDKKPEESATNELTEEEKEAFINELTEASNFTIENVQQLLDEDDFDHEQYEHALSNLLIAKSAQMLLSAPDMNLSAVKPIFDGLKQTAQTFVQQTYHQKCLDIKIQIQQNAPAVAVQKANELILEVDRTGLADLLTFMNTADPNKGKDFAEVAENIKQAMADHSAPSIFK